MQCEALLKRQNPLFDLNDLDSICAREGIEVDTTDNAVSATFQFSPNSPQAGPSRGFPLRGQSPPRGYPYPVPPPGQPMMPPYHGPMPMHYPPYGPPPPHMMHGPPPPGYDPRMGPVQPFQHPLGPPPSGAPPRPSSPHEIRGQDPHSHDMSNTQVSSCIQSSSRTCCPACPSGAFAAGHAGTVLQFGARLEDPVFTATASC